LHYTSLCRGMFIVLYADDILLISPSVCMLEKLVRICEYELDQIDMVINVKNRAACALAREMMFHVMPFEPLMESLYRGLTN